MRYYAVGRHWRNPNSFTHAYIEKSTLLCTLNYNLCPSINAIGSIENSMYTDTAEQSAILQHLHVLFTAQECDTRRASSRTGSQRQTCRCGFPAANVPWPVDGVADAGQWWCSFLGACMEFAPVTCRSVPRMPLLDVASTLANENDN